MSNTLLLTSYITKHDNVTAIVQ